MPVLEGQRSIPSNVSETYNVLQTYKQTTRKQRTRTMHHKHLRAFYEHS